MGNCIRTLGVSDGALWNLYIQTLAIVNKTVDQYYIQVFLHFYPVDMNEMFEQVFRTKLCLNHCVRPLNLSQILELQKKARLSLCYVQQSIKVMRMT